MNEYIMEIPGAATPEYCEMMIEKFEQDGRHHPALVGDGRNDQEIRSSVNLEMPHFPEWKSVMQDIKWMIDSHLKKYLDEIHTEMTGSPWVGGYYQDFTMMRYDPGGVGYKWHNDFIFDVFSPRRGVRTITWLFYLNECDGGETEFKCGKVIKPEAGKLVMFPASWTMVHRGCPVNSGSKYLCVGWLFSTWNRDIKR